jgi:hypothetical protein
MLAGAASRAFIVLAITYVIGVGERSSGRSRRREGVALHIVVERDECGG